MMAYYIKAYSFTDLTTSKLLLAHYMHFSIHGGRKWRQKWTMLSVLGNDSARRWQEDEQKFKSISNRFP